MATLNNYTIIAEGYNFNYGKYAIGSISKTYTNNWLGESNVKAKLDDSYFKQCVLDTVKTIKSRIKEAYCFEEHLQTVLHVLDKKNIVVNVLEIEDSINCIGLRKQYLLRRID